eukprot:COSAG05_NODE_239_length_13139_cov_14.870475_13_plen_84_part_00
MTQTLLERLTEGLADPRAADGGDAAAVDITSISKLVEAVRSAAAQVATQKLLTRYTGQGISCAPTRSSTRRSSTRRSKRKETR